uniref:MULE transposase domain-containing protein n=1 Tax=Lactuca sativa TaxID=4236 RepID=A0A9R1VXI5_LACSA|nr:hypothetical protein LSAT_V11C400220150 [Lactuca sativa]
MDFLDESFIHKVGTSNIGASKAYNLVSSMKGGFDSRGGTAVDFKNFHRDSNSKNGVKDSQMVVDILTNRKLCFSNFLFEVQKDVDDHLIGLFWVDDTSKANYKEFGDVLSFDATYQTNKYSMVFVHFTGVDYHKRCVTFAAGLLARETADAYVWLLEVFRKAFVKPPMMIVTDQDSSMKKVVNFVFPESKHRLCMWHITQKLEENVYSLFLDSYIYKFHLKENDWLRSVFKIRDLWIPAFMRDLELSGLMRTTSRSESLNYAFSHFLHHKSNLVKFMMSFDSAMEKQRHQQSLLDYQSTTTTPKLRTPLAIEKHASEIYTHNIFLDIQKELYKSVFYCVQESLVIEDENTYAILRLSINKIANNEGELAKYIKQLQEVDSGIPLCTSSRASSSRSVHIEKIIGVAAPDVVNIHNPEGIRNKGWASGKRIKSTREKVIEKSKKDSRLCSLCHKPNHNARSCILRLKKSDLESEVTEG